MRTELPTEQELRARDVRGVLIFGLTFVLAAGMVVADLLGQGSTTPLRIALAVVFGIVFGAALMRWIRRSA